MKIELIRLDGAYHMQATNELGNTIETDGSPDIGGSNKAMRPMQLMLAGLGSCSSIDVILILRKQRQNLQDIKLTVTAEREKNRVPSLFTKINVHYDLYGDLSEKKVERAIELSMKKYCSVAKLLKETATIEWSFQIHYLTEPD